MMIGSWSNNNNAISITVESNSGTDMVVLVDMRWIGASFDLIHSDSVFSNFPMTSNKGFHFIQFDDCQLILQKAKYSMLFQVLA